MHERIEHTEAADEPVIRRPEDARDSLPMRLDRLPEAHPSSDRYQDAGLSTRDGRGYASRADTTRADSEDATRARAGDAREATGRPGSGWDAPSARDYADRPADSDIQLSAERDRHVLEGDGEGKPGGGHRYGTNKPGKTEFPENWSDEKIRQTVVDVSRNPDSVLRERTDRWLVTGDRDGVRVSAVVLTDGQIWTAWPHPGGAGVRQNPKAGAT